MKPASFPLSKRTSTCRFVAASVVSESLLPSNLLSLDTPENAYDFWQSIVSAEVDHEPQKESLIIVLNNSSHRPYAWNRVSLGTLTETNCHPREVLRPAIAGAAHSFVLMHNHPSGDPHPSRADDMFTRRILEAAKLLCIDLLDHLIIGTPAPGRTPYFSFREAGIIP